MGALPRPDIAPGPHRDLVGALHRLHHEAGWPSLRSLARAVGCSPTTVSAVFSAPRLPTWGLLELVVEALEGDVEAFHELWCAAGDPEPSPLSRPGRLAGRRREIAVLRRHLTEGSGRLLLVTGEAGIGKTALVGAADRLVEDLVVVYGSCLPLATEVPLLPVTELLRGIHDHDEGRSLEEALADCPPYVGGAIAPLLPELEHSSDAAPAVDTDWDRQRLYGAVQATLTALGAQRRFTAVIEDLHWADSATLDLLDYLLAAPRARSGISILASYRTEDPTTPPATADWLLRMTGHAHVEVLELGPLTPEETAEQLEQLGHRVSADLVARIHGRAAGQPLFTEQLAAEAQNATGEEEALPRRLAELLDRRLVGIKGDEWRVARALGIADRELTHLQLQQVTGLSADPLSVVLHGLTEGRLLGAGGGAQVRLRHPLLAEAIRSRMVPGEASEEHGRVATALATSPTASAAEVAEHWRRAGAPGQELEWRIRAARAAEARFARAQAGHQWQRALALWPDDAATAGTQSVTRTAAYLAAMDALAFTDVASGSAVAEDAMRALPDPSNGDAAETYQLAAEFQCFLHDPASALQLLDRALRIYEGLPACAGHARALARREFFEDSLGDGEAAGAATSAALRVAQEVGDPRLVREMLSHRAPYDAFAGNAPLALSRIQEALDIAVPEADPIAEIYLAIVHAVILEHTGADAGPILAAGRRGLDVADTWALENFPVAVLQSNLSWALRREGDVRAAAELVDPVTEDAPTQERYPVHYERAVLDALRGRPVPALDRIAALAEFPITHFLNRIECAADAASVEVWCNQPGSALDRATATLEDSMEVDAPDLLSQLLVLAARAAADLAASSATADGTGQRHLARLQALRARATTDPLGLDTDFPERPARAASWSAETARLVGHDSAELWIRAADLWRRRRRPHEAAYCRWRGAQAAARGGDLVVASSLLRAATREAREHVPLLDAVRESAARVP
jgi:tetratricopeptide (TPR) repeat protein